MEKSKERLKNALLHLEQVLESKFAKLELENQTLRNEFVKHRTEKPTGPGRKRLTKEELPNGTKAAESKGTGTKPTDSLVNEKASQAIDLSLKELKKLIG